MTKKVEIRATMANLCAMIEHPTGLEIRFEREMAAVIPGWNSEVAKMEPPVEARPPRPAVKRELKRYRPHPRKVPKAE